MFLINMLFPEKEKKKKYVEILTKNLVPIKIFYQFFHQSVILEREWINFHLYTNGWSSYIGHKYSSQKGIGSFFFFSKNRFSISAMVKYFNRSVMVKL